MNGAYRIDDSLGSAAAVVPAIAGMMIGAKLRARIAPATFCR